MDIPTELVVEILLRLPWTSRRRLRLVCRFWRDLVHELTTEMQQRREAVPLIVTTESAYVIDNNLDKLSSKSCIPRELHLGGGLSYEHMEVVGVCNGVLCLCDDAKPGGAITLTNPATGDVLALPPIPRAGLFRRHNTRRSGRSWHQAYSFGYHHETGQYKVVHVPCFFKTKDTLQVFTLGEASWREVSAPAIKVWVLERRRKERTWIHLYRFDSFLSQLQEQMARPYFIHGKYVLVEKGHKLELYKHKPTIDENEERPECSVLYDNTCYLKATVSKIRGHICHTFAYIETDEALSVYRRW